MLCSAGLSQVNTEKFRKYNEKNGFLFNTGLRFGYSGGNSEYISFDGTVRLDYNGNKNDAFIVANLDYKETEASKVVHKGFVHLRGIRHLNDKMAWELFIQQEFNEFLLLNDRNLIGSSLRFNIMDFRSEKDTLTVFQSNLGLGLMHERETYDLGTPEDNLVKLDPFRISTYLTFDWTISNRMNCWAVVYFQPNTERFKDFRTVVETGIEIWLVGKLYLSTDLSYRYNNEPVGDVKSYDVVIKNGLRLSIP
jgi:hypothetical protein